jgi:two-component system response regulator RegA
MSASASDPHDRARLLLVDDDAALCEVLSRALADRGFDVTTARTVEDAIRTIDAEPPEYAVVDLRSTSSTSSLPMAATSPPPRAHCRCIAGRSSASCAGDP